jgi:hypothetical protein
MRHGDDCWEADGVRHEVILVRNLIKYVLEVEKQVLSYTYSIIMY